MTEDERQLALARKANSDGALMPYVWFMVVAMLVVVGLQFAILLKNEKDVIAGACVRRAQVIVELPRVIPTLPEVVVVGKKERS